MNMTTLSSWPQTLITRFGKGAITILHHFNRPCERHGRARRLSCTVRRTARHTQLEAHVVAAATRGWPGQAGTGRKPTPACVGTVAAAWGGPWAGVLAGGCVPATVLGGW